MNIQQDDIPVVLCPWNYYVQIYCFQISKSGQYGPAADLDIVDISGEEAVRLAAAVSDKTSSKLSRALFDSRLHIDDTCRVIHR